MTGLWHPKTQEVGPTLASDGSNNQKESNNAEEELVIALPSETKFFLPDGHQLCSPNDCTARCPEGGMFLPVNDLCSMVQRGLTLQPVTENGGFVLIGSNITLHEPETCEGTVSVTPLPAGTIVKFERAKLSGLVQINSGVVERDALLGQVSYCWTTFSKSITLGPAGLILQRHTHIPSAMMLAGNTVLKSDTVFVTEPRFLDCMPFMQDGKTKDWSECYKDVWPSGTVFPAATILPANTILVRGTHIPGGTVIPGGTSLNSDLPVGTILPKGTVVQNGMWLPVTHLRDFKLFSYE